MIFIQSISSVPILEDAKCKQAKNPQKGLREDEVVTVYIVQALQKQLVL